MYQPQACAYSPNQVQRYGPADHHSVFSPYIPSDLLHNEEVPLFTPSNYREQSYPVYKKSNPDFAHCMNIPNGRTNQECTSNMRQDLTNLYPYTFHDSLNEFYPAIPAEPFADTIKVGSSAQPFRRETPSTIFASNNSQQYHSIQRGFSYEGYPNQQESFYPFPTSDNPSSMNHFEVAAPDYTPQNKSGYKTNAICIEDVISNRNKHFTIMIRNIPNRYTKEALLELLSSIIPNSYRLITFPIDEKTTRNLGYCFIQVSDNNILYRLYQNCHNKLWPHSCSNKKCCLCYSIDKQPKRKK